MEDMIIYLTLLSMILSVFIAGFVLRRYMETRKEHLLLWFYAWSIVAFRTGTEVFLITYECTNAILYFVDILTTAHSILWFIGLAVLLGMSKNWKFTFPFAYLMVHATTVAYIYLILGNKTLGATITYGIFVPLMFFILAWFFYEPARKTKKIGLSLVTGAFFLWGLDYIIFGIPYYAYGNKTAGVIGWILGYIFRVLVLLGFYYMVKEVE